MTFHLTHPPADPNYCEACGETVRSMRVHRGSAVCVRKTRERLIREQDLERYFDKGDVFRNAGLPSVAIRVDNGKLGYYSTTWAVRLNVLLTRANYCPEARSRLLELGPDSPQVERALAFAALRGSRSA